MELEGKIAVVTGAASGIGRALALALENEGCQLALVDLRSLEGLPGSHHRVDVSKREAMQELAQDVVDEHGAVHVVVNNAGLTVGASFADHTQEHWDRVMGVNLYGVVNGCKAFLPHLLRADRARLVNVSSIFGLCGMPGQAAYVASKSAVRGLSMCLTEELRGTSVGVTTVLPAGISTQIIANSEFADHSTKVRLNGWFAGRARPPEYAAKRIVRALHRDEARVRITPEAVAIDWVVRLAPP